MLTSDSDSQEGDRYAGEELGEHSVPPLLSGCWASTNSHHDQSVRASVLKWLKASHKKEFAWFLLCMCFLLNC